MSAETETRTISAAEFKAKCLQLMDEVNEKQTTITVTKRGKVVGHFIPKAPEQRPFQSLFGRTPGGRVPDPGKWRKLKDEWADEWDESTERLARQLTKGHKGDR